MPLSDGLIYRAIDPALDAESCYEHQRDACLVSFGNERALMPFVRYRQWLTEHVEEFPDGFLLSHHCQRCVGHLELQVPYGLDIGYINLFYVTPEFRGLGYARVMHERAERYFHSWEARRIQLHVSLTNERAIRFYRALGYRAMRREGRVWRMQKTLVSASLPC